MRANLDFQLLIAVHQVHYQWAERICSFALRRMRPADPGRFLKRAGFRTGDTVPPVISLPRGAISTEIRRREGQNLFAVLQKAGWKIKGADGAAELPGLSPTTLFARIQKIGLKRPALNECVES
ncbi:MAG: hypothetical protein WBZ19_30620 [Chthoniobacterales bacterium]